MALGTFIDVRTLASMTAAATVSFAHGLPASPDFVLVMGAQTLASNATPAVINELHDATNVTLQNSGEGPTPTVIRVISVVAHSIIR